ncbi:MAG: carbohydrate kinase family protein [Gammaproteobacteria bacterium]
MKHIVCFGETLIDFHAQPAAADGPPSFVPYPGGAPANVAVAVARLGGDVAFAGMLGKDLFGDMLLRGLEEAGVDTRYVRRTDAANTGLAFVALDEHGERSFSFYRPPSADLLFRESAFDDGAFAASSIFHTGSCSMTEDEIAEVTLAGMRRARDAGALVSFDMNLRPALWPRGSDPTPLLWAALENAALVKLSADEFAFLAAPLGGEDAVRKRLWQGATRLLLVTDGDGPIRWFTRSVDGAWPAFEVFVLDSTGAGDAFVGGFLLGLATQDVGADALDAFGTDERLRNALLRFAAACGALAVTHVGSFAAMPSRDAVEHFLETHT